MRFKKQAAQSRHIIIRYSVELYIKLDQVGLPNRTKVLLAKIEYLIRKKEVTMLVVSKYYELRNKKLRYIYHFLICLNVS